MKVIENKYKKNIIFFILLIVGIVWVALSGKVTLVLEWFKSYPETFTGIATIGTCITAVLAYIKYRDEKNKELYIKMLNEVYGPLYLYLTTQEAAREIFANFKDEFRKVYNKDDIPIFELGKNMCEDGLNETLFKPDDFFEITKKADRALMSPSLVNLIGAYQSIEYLYDEKDSSKKLYFDEKRRVIQKKIVNEVLRGYQECTKRIGMHETSSIINIYKYSIDKLE